MISDQIGDLLTRIRNAVKVQKESALVSFSQMNLNILNVVKEAGYIEDFQKIHPDSKTKKYLLKILFKYKNKISVIQGIKRISKPGLRIYSNTNDLPKVLNGIGIAVVSTSQGVITAQEAKKRKLGGEVLAYVW